MERRLAAILAADVVGYSRLVAADEAGTLDAFRAHRQELVEPKIAAHRGRIVKLMGDGVLAEFASVVDAVACALALQQGMHERSRGVPEDRQIRLRIGINLGDIISEDGDIHGEGVNLAARLEALAEPGGICVSRTVRNHVQDKLPLTFEDLGEKTLKNIPRPVQVFWVSAGGAPAAAPRPRRRRWSWRHLAPVAAMLLLAAALAWWQPWASDEPAGAAREPAFALPDRPSIAVLPFANLSEDESQQYFAEGMAADIIADLSQIPSLFVIARNSSFQFGADAEASEVAEKLGVRFVLDGSVRRAGGDVRINAQLVDARSGGYVWAERFDGATGEIFELQDRVTGRIAESLAVTLAALEPDPRGAEPTVDPEAHDAFLRGRAHYQRNTPQDYAKAIPYLEQAIELDPQHRRAFAVLAAVYWKAFANGRLSRGGEWVRSLGHSLSETFALAAENLGRALAAERVPPLAYQVSSGMAVFQGRHDEAIAEAEQAIAIDPNDPAGYEALGFALIFAGEPGRSVDVLRTAMRLDPRYEHNYRHWLGLAQFGLERFAQAARSLADASRRNPADERILIPLAASYGMLGRSEEGRQAVAWLNDLREQENRRLDRSELTPGIDVFLLGHLTLQDIKLWPFKEQADRDRLRAGLARVGVPASGPDEQESPKSIPGAVTIDAATAKRLFERGVPFVDVRGPSWNLGHIPGATHLFLKEDFDEAALAGVAQKHEEVVIYCMGPNCLLSSEACAQAVAWGYDEVYYFRDGFPAWQAAGYPVAIPE